MSLRPGAELEAPMWLVLTQPAPPLDSSWSWSSSQIIHSPHCSWVCWSFGHELLGCGIVLHQELKRQYRAVIKVWEENAWVDIHEINWKICPWGWRSFHVNDVSLSFSKSIWRDFWSSILQVRIITCVHVGACRGYRFAHAQRELVKIRWVKWDG